MNCSRIWTRMDAPMMSNRMLENVIAVGGELDHAHHVDAHAFARLHLASAEAVGAVLINAALERRADALARHLDDAKLRNL